MIQLPLLSSSPFWRPRTASAAHRPQALFSLSCSPCDFPVTRPLCVMDFSLPGLSEAVLPRHPSQATPQWDMDSVGHWLETLPASPQIASDAGATLLCDCECY